MKLATHAVTGHKVAVKILNKAKIKQLGMEEKVQREINILHLCTHPHIIRLYEVKEFPTRNVFTDQEDVRRRVNDLVQADDVRVRTQMQNVYLTLDFFFHGQLLDLGLVQDLDGDFVSSHHMCSKFDLQPESATL